MKKFNELIDLPSVAKNTADYQAARKLYKEGKISKEEFAELKKKTKGRLPVYMPHASAFLNNYRNDENAIPSGGCMLDLDDIGDARAFYEENVESRIDELGILLAHITPSGEGLRINFKAPKDLTLAEAQLWIANRLGIEKYDTSCCDYARPSYVPTRANLLYISDEFFAEEFLSQEISEAERTAIQVLAQERKGTHATCATSTAAETAADTASDFSTTTADGTNAPHMFRVSDDVEIPYEDIINEWFSLTGGEPYDGCRNARLSQLAFHIRNICDRNQALMLEIMPDYGLPKDEMKTIIASACETKKGGYFQTKVIKQAIKLAAMKNGKTAAASALDKYEDDAPQMPTKLPPFMRLMLSNVPDIYKPAVAMSIFAALNAHIHNVHLHYVDGKFKEPTSMCILVAPTGEGKSCVDDPIAHIMADIDARDAINAAEDKRIKEENAKKGANDRKLARPENCVIQRVLPNITVARLFQSLADAQGHFLYMQMSELDGFNKLKEGANNYHHLLIRLAYDCAKDGQMRVGYQSVTEFVNVKLLFNASTTPTNLMKFFPRQALVDGTVNRINFASIPEQADDADIPQQGDYLESFDEQLKPYIDNLLNAKDNARIGNQTYLKIPKATAFAKKMLEHCKQITILSGSKAYKSFSRRAVLSAWFRACMLYIVHGNHWSAALEELVMWSLDYDLHNKMKFFGDALQEEIDKEQRVLHPAKSGTVNWLELLPEVFTVDDLNMLRAQKNCTSVSSSAATQIRNYVHRNHVKRNPDGTFTNLYKLNNNSNL
ncbi:MAG: DUF3987 domain-containing protein [Prevotellaceae bacterium]|nr:DUF3987 domain-containing protein [Prevotellaceae bacterium]